MKMKLSGFLALIGFALAVTGCVRTVDGGFSSGVPFSRDTKESHYERTVEQVFPAAREVLVRNGTITKEDVVGKVLEGMVDTRHVWIRMYQVNDKVVRVVTQVRTRNGTGDLNLAAEIDKEIALQMQATSR